MMKIALVSDIHGNSWAFEEVLRDIERKKPGLIVNLGDSLYGPLNPRETFNLLEKWDILSVSGNEDRLILENIGREDGNSTVRYVIKEMPDAALYWLKSLPATRTLDGGIFMCHGTPQSDSAYLLEDVQSGRAAVNDAAKIEALLARIDQKLVFCGHSHVPRIVHTEKRTILNPGSVGLNAYDDDIPIRHKMENYHPNAQYCIVEISDDGVRAEQIAIPYDVQKAASCAARNNREDWASWLLTGRA